MILAGHQLAKPLKEKYNDWLIYIYTSREGGGGGGVGGGEWQLEFHFGTHA